jgi:hypothetical protein
MTTTLSRLARGQGVAISQLCLRGLVGGGKCLVKGKLAELLGQDLHAPGSGPARGSERLDELRQPKRTLTA